jgi:hypothetical protein
MILSGHVERLRVCYCFTSARRNSNFRYCQMEEGYALFGFARWGGRVLGARHARVTRYRR